MILPLAKFIGQLSIAIVLGLKATASAVYLEDVIVTESTVTNPFNDAVIKEPTTGAAQQIVNEKPRGWNNRHQETNLS